MTLNIRFHDHALCLMDGDTMIIPLEGCLDAPCFRDPSFFRLYLRREPTAEEVTFWATFMASEVADMLRWWKWSSAIRTGKITVETE